MSTLTNEQCTDLLGQAAEWLGDADPDFCCDFLEASWSDVLQQPYASIDIVTPDDLLVRFYEGKPVRVGDLFIVYRSLFKRPDADRPKAKLAVDALASVASELPLPIYRACGSFLDSKMIGAPSLTVEYAYEPTVQDQATLLGYLANKVYSYNSSGDPVVMTAPPNEQGIPTPYDVRVGLMPPDRT